MLSLTETPGRKERSVPFTGLAFLGMALTGLKCERYGGFSGDMWDEMASSFIVAAMRFLGRAGGRAVVLARMQPILNPCLIPLTMKVAKSLSGIGGKCYQPLLPIERSPGQQQ